MNNEFPCAGIILANTHSEVLVVYNQNGHPSFPKGKRNSGETSMACALRELAEETGISAASIRVDQEKVIKEKSRAGNPSVLYYFATLLHENNQRMAIKAIDGDEIERGEWIPVASLVAENWRENRKIVAEKAVEFVLSNTEEGKDVEK